ncbi:MAG: hypothetical protein AAF715_16740 [Myxococcota bacterium]
MNATDHTSRSPRRLRRWALRAALALAGVSVGAVVAEGAFYLRDEGAFPHLNAYVADETLGVRLEAGFEGAVRVGSGPVTSFAIHREGYRGPPWPAPGEDDVLVVGDSQVFGLGVAGSEAFPARLAVATGRTVLNAGVPTYGPPEYLAVAADLLARRKPKTVVFTINIGNDLVEANRPNPERHAVWDGWAVRKETAPLSVQDFPGRSWLYRRSHLVFAARKLLYETQHPELSDAAFPSEGAWQDLVRRSDESQRRRAASREEREVAAALRPVETSYLEDELRRAQASVEDLIYEEFTGQDYRSSLLLRSARATPGDIVTSGPGEAGSPYGATTKIIREGAAFRAKMEAKLRETAAALADEARKKDIVTTLEERDALAAKLAALRAAPLLLSRATSPLAAPIERMKALCDEHGAELVVLVLQLDVMVSPEEWEKYDAEPTDMTSTRVLVDDVLSLSRGLGVRAVDPTDALRAAQPGAFLRADLHLSPTGHRVVADAIAERLERPPPAVMKPGLPVGRSRLPSLRYWRASRELLISGTTAAACRSWLRQEWLLLRCFQRGSEAHQATGTYDRYVQGGDVGPRPVGARVVEGGRGETEWFVYGGVLSFIAPLFPGGRLVADLFWEDHRRRLVVNWPAEEPVADEITLRKQEDLGEVPTGVEEPAELCACHRQVTGAEDCRELMGRPDEDCRRTYGDDCAGRLGCVAGDPLFPPECIEGEVNAFARDRCYRPCDAACARPCVSWQGVSLCPEP